jgi:hypothetical protein
MRNSSGRGQATVEYIFILAFIVFLAFRATSIFTNFFSDSMGSVGHVLSGHLTVGICPTECFFAGYENGYYGSP